MKKALIAACLSIAPLLALAQAGGVTFNLDQESPLSKWGRWTYLEQDGSDYGLKLAQNRNKMPLTANWHHGNWVFKMNRDMLSSKHDLFFGLQVSQDQMQTTSLGCMSNHGKNGYGTALCGVQMDLNLR